MKKYRVVKETNNMVTPPSTKYVIQKHIKLLFWSWWSTNYLAGPEPCHEEDTKEKALNTCKILNGEREWVSKEIVSME